jgi:hypothetical protein
LRCTIVLDESPVAEVEVPDPWGRITSHVAVVCPVTGQIWARLYYHGPGICGWSVDRYPSADASFDESWEWTWYPKAVAGSLAAVLTNIQDPVCPEFFPPSLVEREFFLFLKHARRLGWLPRK